MCKCKILIKRAYDKIEDKDGKRILVDRLWPRGKTKESLKLDSWEKSIAPSNEIRKVFNHELEKFPEFKESYLKELDENPASNELVTNCREWLKESNVSLVYSAKDEEHNNAVVLKDWLERNL